MKKEAATATILITRRAHGESRIKFVKRVCFTFLPSPQFLKRLPSNISEFNSCNMTSYLAWVWATSWLSFSIQLMIHRSKIVSVLNWERKENHSQTYDISRCVLLILQKSTDRYPYPSSRNLIRIRQWQSRAKKLNSHDIKMRWKKKYRIILDAWADRLLISFDRKYYDIILFSLVLKSKST